jgi:PhnB protein
MKTDSFRTSIAPWLIVRGGVEALNFYKTAFSATEVFHMDGPDGSVVARLSVDGAEFWLSDGSPEPVVEPSVRMILTVADPDAVFAQALKAGAIQVYPVGNQHGWRLGRLVDPFGHHWEIGRDLAV